MRRGVCHRLDLSLPASCVQQGVGGMSAGVRTHPRALQGSREALKSRPVTTQQQNCRRAPGGEGVGWGGGHQSGFPPAVTVHTPLPLDTRWSLNHRRRILSHVSVSEHVSSPSGMRTSHVEAHSWKRGLRRGGREGDGKWCQKRQRESKQTNKKISVLT